MKTGYTKEAGYGLVGSATRGDRRLIMVLAGAKSINERKQEAQKLLDWGFSQFKTFEVYDKGERVSRATVWGGVKRRVELRATELVSVTLTPAEQAIVEVKLAYDGPLIAPVEQGQKVGKLRFIVDGVLLDEVPVETSEAVEADPSMWSRALDSLSDHGLRQLTCQASSSHSKAGRGPVSPRRSPVWPSAFQPRAAR